MSLFAMGHVSAVINRFIPCLLGLALLWTMGPAVAKTVSVGTLSTSAITITNSFTGAASFTDYYTFTLSAGGTLSGNITDSELALTTRDVAISSIQLTGGTLASAKTDTNSSDGFSFAGLGAGNYTLAIAGSVSAGRSVGSKGTYNGSFKYAATSISTSGPIASAAPEPADLALTVVGLMGVAMLVRLRSRSGGSMVAVAPCAG